MTAHPVSIAYRGQGREISPGQTYSFRLIPEMKPDRPQREREQERVGEEQARAEADEDIV